MRARSIQSKDLGLIRVAEVGFFGSKESDVFGGPAGTVLRHKWCGLGRVGR